MKIRTKILLCTICPILLLGIIVCGIILGPVSRQMTQDTENLLKSTACAALASYTQNSGEFFQSPNGDIWKGGYNISRSGELVDEIKEVTGMEKARPILVIGYCWMDVYIMDILFRLSIRGKL